MKDDRVYLLHIRDCLDRIADYTRDGRDAFFADTKTQDAVIRNFEIVGHRRNARTVANRRRLCALQ
ncbi:MAG: hypothetical protein KAV82_06980 [Phycisphaerae bacterium]|nr:hypothetical protein [Phycisphaerae bacterium]